MLLRRHKNRNEEHQELSPDVPSKEKAFEDMTVEELKAYADDNEIDLGRASSQEGILKKIQESTEEGNTSEEEAE